MYYFLYLLFGVQPTKIFKKGGKEMRNKSKRMLAVAMAMVTLASTITGCGYSSYADEVANSDEIQEAVIVEDESEAESTEDIVINAPIPEDKPDTSGSTTVTTPAPSTGGDQYTSIDTIVIPDETKSDQQGTTPSTTPVDTAINTLPNNNGGISGNDIMLEEVQMEESAMFAINNPGNQRVPTSDVYVKFNYGGYINVETNKTHIDTGARENIKYNLSRDSETNFAVTRTVNGKSASAYTEQDSGAVAFRALMPEQWDFQQGEQINIKVDAEHGFFVDHVKVTEIRPDGEVLYEFKSDKSRPIGLNTIQVSNRAEDIYVDVEFTAYSFSDRGDLDFNIQPDDATSGSYIIPFILTNEDTGERHFIVTDKTGNYHSHNSFRLHSVSTNGDDAHMEMWLKDNGYVVDLDAVHPNYGTWFATSKVGDEVVQNNKGALPVGNYLLQEIRCAYNSDKGLIQRHFNVTKDGERVDLGTLTQKTIVGAPILSTQLLDYSSGTHSANGETSVRLYERVHLANIETNHFYNIKVDLYMSDGITRVYTTKNGTADNPRTHVKGEYTINSGEVHQNYATIDIPLTEFDGDNYIGENLVAVCTVSDNGHYTGSNAVVHGDTKNISEMVWIPRIDQTFLWDNATRDHVGANLDVREDNALLITDTIDYSYLAPYDAMTLVSNIEEANNGNANQQVYLAEGQLFDEETGELVATATPKEFTTSNVTTPDGSVDIQYRIPTAMDGRTLRSYVTISADNGTVLATHNKVNHPNDPEEEVHYLNVITSAGSEGTNHVGIVAEDANETVPVIDSVRLDNLVVGEDYVIKGILRYADTGEKVTNDGVDVTGETEFTASAMSERHEVTYNIASANLAGRTVVAYEYIWHMSNHTSPHLVMVAKHADITDEEQAIHFPEITTKAVDANTLDEVGKAGDTEVVDTVSYRNLIPGQEYTIEGILMDAETGEYLGKDQGLAECKATKTFTPDSADGEIELTYILNATTLQGHTTVVFENLKVNGIVVRHHEKLSDLNQTLYFPKVVTEASASSGLKEQLAYGSQMVFDKVELTNLVVGKEYTIKGILYDKATKRPYLSAGKTVECEPITFTATNKKDSKIVQFNIPDASNLENHTLVAFETLVHNGIEVALHDDINDFKQSVKYPKISTVAVDADTLLDEGIGDDDATIKDTVSYSNLEDGATYTVMGTIYNRESGVPYQSPNGYVLAETTFTAKNGKAEIVEHETRYVTDLDVLKETLAGAASSETELGKTFSEDVVSGTVELVFDNYDATGLLGYTAVCADYLFRDGVVVAKHDDINDQNQDVKYIKTTTLATDKVTGTHESDYGNTVIVDKVMFENLTKGNTYTLVSTVVDLETGEALMINNVPVEVETEVTATARDQEVTVEIPVDTKELEGKTFVVIENLYRNDKLVSVHDDQEDKDQTIYLPELHTFAYDADTLRNEGDAKEDSTFVDEVYYSNLTVGEEYTVVGYLYDKTTNERLVINDEEVKASVNFVGGQSEESEIGNTVEASTEDGRASGMIHVRFNFDATQVEGKDIVAVQYVYNSNDEIVAHSSNLNDEAEIINYPYVRTVLVDSESERHDSQQKEETTLVDTVTYRNLRIGNSYTVVGVLMDKATGEPVDVNGDIVTAIEYLEAVESRDGKVQLTYTFDSSKLDDVDVVAYEYLLFGDFDYGMSPIDDVLEGGDSTGTEVKPSVSENEPTKPSYPFNPDLGETGNENEDDNTPDSGADQAGSPLVGKHSDIEDDAQRVALIRLVSEALDIKTGTHESESSADAEVVNTINYHNLYGVGETYVLKGILVDKETGEVIPVKTETEEQMVSVEFKPEQRSGSIKMHFNVDSTELKNKDVVAYVRLFKDGKEVARYEDLEELLETVHIPEVYAELLNFDAEDHEGNAVEHFKAVNNISYSNLTYGEKYVAEVVLYDAETGKPYLGKAIAEGSKLPEPEVSGNDVSGNTVESPEEGISTLAANEEDTVISSPEEKPEEGNTGDEEVTEPSVSGNEPVEEPVSEEGAVIAYREFYAGRNSLLGGAVNFIADLIGINPVSHGKRADGIIALDFEFDARAAAGKDLVAYTRIYRADSMEEVATNMIVARVEEQENADQTISFPKITTVLVDKASGAHSAVLATNAAYTDTITYTNLIAGEEYDVTGTLMNKATGQPVKVGDAVVRATMKITPKESNGTAVMPFNWNSNALVNNSVVAYEVVTRGGFQRASHEDINDANQTVAVVAPPRRGGGGRSKGVETGISTVALDKASQSHTVTLGTASIIQDTIKYWGLENGTEYTVRTTVWDLTKDVHVFGVENKFKAGKDYETWTVEMPMNTTGMEGDTLIVYQNIYKGDKLVVGHSDKEDKNQQLYVALPPTIVPTGDILYALVAIGAIAIAIGGTILIRGKKEEDTPSDKTE